MKEKEESLRREHGIRTSVAGMDANACSFVYVFRRDAEKTQVGHIAVKILALLRARIFSQDLIIASADSILVQP